MSTLPRSAPSVLCTVTVTGILVRWPGSCEKCPRPHPRRSPTFWMKPSRSETGSDPEDSAVCDMYDCIDETSVKLETQHQEFLSLASMARRRTAVEAATHSQIHGRHCCKAQSQTAWPVCVFVRQSLATMCSEVSRPTPLPQPRPLTITTAYRVCHCRGMACRLLPLRWWGFLYRKALI